jgi:dTDP-4-dehydrorhamnose 3,5-epimerase
MDVQPLEIAGVWLVTPRVLDDARGSFLEWYRDDALEATVGAALPLAQANLSVSRRGALRGIHTTDVPPGQAKYVTCVAGSVLDVAVDLRTGSPTFGRHVATRLDDVDRRGVYLAEGLGHAFLALTEPATVAYLCSSRYEPSRDRAVHPLDPALGLPWPIEVSPLLSAKDAAAPSLAEAVARGDLPSYEACRGYRRRGPGNSAGRGQ